MRHASTLPIALVSATMATFAADGPPPDDSNVSFEIEPPLLIQNQPTEPQAVTADPNVDPIRLEKELERAKRNAVGAERLCKIGALSKLEAEQRALKVIQVESDLENLRLARTKEELVEQKHRLATGEISKEDVATTELALVRATVAAEAAIAKREQAELKAAEINLHRQQKLLAAGSGRKSDIDLAEKKLADLKAPKDKVR